MVKYHNLLFLFLVVVIFKSYILNSIIDAKFNI